MKRFEFRKGVKLPDYKYRSLSTTRIHRIGSPERITVPLAESSGAMLSPCVSAGDHVAIGSLLADRDHWNSVPVHSSTSGYVSQVEADFIQVSSDGNDQVAPPLHAGGERPRAPEEMIRMIREAGIVDLGGTARPVHRRIEAARAACVETVVIDGCESEPFLTADHLLMINHSAEILKGAELIRLASGASRAVIVVEENKLEAAEIVNSKNYQLKLENVSTKVVPTRYPQGSERVLAGTILGGPLAAGESAVRAGVLIEHVATAFAVYEAIVLAKPFYERAITVGGPCVVEPRNLWAGIGTSAEALVRACKGFLRDPERLVFGGPMTGRTVRDLQAPVTKEVRGILALPPELTPKDDEQPCVRCGLCVEVCPEPLDPEAIVKAVQKGALDRAKDYGIEACVECGACAYVCPSRIPMVSILRKGKSKRFQKFRELQPAYDVPAYP